MSFYSLLASFFELTGTENFDTTVRYGILQQKNCCAKTDVAVGFVAFRGILTIKKKLGLNFSRKFKICFIEIRE